MEQMSHWVTAAAMGALCVGGFFLGSRAPNTPPQKLEGVLYSAETASMTATDQDTDTWQRTLKDAIHYPEVNLSFDPETSAQLPKATAFLVHVVPATAGVPRLTLIPQVAVQKRAGRPKPRIVATAKLAASPAPAPTPTPAPQPAPPPPAPIVVAAPAPPPAPPKPTQPVTFAEFDEALRGNPTTEAINQRHRPIGGVVFRLTHVGVVGDQAVVRFAIANEGSADFFLSIVNVMASGTPIHSETAGPLVCRAGGTEVYGVVHFTRADIVGKAVSIELVESGGDRRRFPVDVPYKF